MNLFIAVASKAPPLAAHSKYVKEPLSGIRKSVYHELRLYLLRFNRVLLNSRHSPAVAVCRPPLKPAIRVRIMQYITVSGNQNNDIYDDGYLRIEHENHYVSCGGRYVSLSRKEFLIISRLARNPDRVVTYQEIWQHAWGKKSAFNPKSLRVYVYRLRNRLASSGISIESMVNVGYRLRIPALVGGNRTDATSDRL